MSNRSPTHLIADASRSVQHRPGLARFWWASRSLASIASGTPKTRSRSSRCWPTLLAWKSSAAPIRNYRDHIPNTILGRGRFQEIHDLRGELNYDVVVFDDELTGSQTRNLEESLQVRIIDRTQLILDIFGQHAQTREGRLQVELAQHEYLLPRLRGQWGHLSRQTATSSASGAIGVRGPGETQLETDRRLVGRRIVMLKAQLEEVRRHRERYRERRRQSGIPVVSLVGYTNAGKSTVLNALSEPAYVPRINSLRPSIPPRARSCSPVGARSS